MIQFIDGPAKGTTLDLRRAPVFLRVVIDPVGDVFDALDQLDDVPKPHESIHVYRLIGQPTRYHVSLSPRRLSGCRYAAEYQFVAQQPDDLTMRDTAARHRAVAGVGRSPR